LFLISSGGSGRTEAKMNKILSPFIAGLVAALVFITLYPKFGGWTIVIAVVSFPIIFWIAQAVIDILSQLFKGKK
jgi:hypothetical protein